MPKFREFRTYTGRASYHVHVSWSYLQEHLDSWRQGYCVEMNPDFQRGHVWTEEQQIAYIEFKMKGGPSGEDIYWNHPYWQSGRDDAPLQLVDGLQRITAVFRFINNEIKAFGYYYKEFEDTASIIDLRFSFYINDLKMRDEVLKWYLELNEGGTPHTKEEIDKVYELLKYEKRAIANLVGDGND